MKLALGTVQFGVKYGLSGATKLLSDQDIRKILELAFERGITILDTAPGYGDIESRLAILTEGLDFEFVSKIQPVPESLDLQPACEWAINSANSSRERLGHKLKALLFHRAEDLAGERGAAIWNATFEWASARAVLLGASSYEVSMVRELSETRGIAIAQLPGNALDQRIKGGFTNLLHTPKLHLRSAFLQGLLLLPFEIAAKTVGRSGTALRKWHGWLHHRALAPLEGALSIVKGFDEAETCVVGVDSIAQLREVTDAWAQATPLQAAELACDDPLVIDPRNWSK
jgi:aryl-alcohol dehydrogenase-like predicted oxidoreductase